ncbi:MAG: molybdenum cofactor guanylyltransferase [Pseudomonadales bacterium]|jgi:molybdopterin-guanine dinucleotide biosynthesis protein A|nr:molybdenum cofactor guanylyltransferase [Pseudomonadales bacterium]
MFYGVILAGGASSRMGEDKRLLSLHGQTLLERAEALLEAAGAEFVLFSGAQVEGRACIADTHAGNGPPGAVLSVLEHVREHYGLDSVNLLFVPVDMPLLSEATLKLLLDASVNAAACHFENQVFPCTMKATPDLYMYLKELFTEGSELGGKRSMRGILTWLQSKVAPTEEIAELEFLNVNTPEDWRRLLQVQRL